MTSRYGIKIPPEAEIDMYLFDDKLILTKKKKPESSSDPPTFLFTSIIDVSKSYQFSVT